jgi:hypothetical protein
MGILDQNGLSFMSAHIPTLTIPIELATENVRNISQSLKNGFKLCASSEKDMRIDRPIFSHHITGQPWDRAAKGDASPRIITCRRKVDTNVTGNASRAQIKLSTELPLVLVDSPAVFCRML